MELSTAKKSHIRAEVKRENCQRKGFRVCEEHTKA
jgi:hypothetical protein